MLSSGRHRPADVRALARLSCRQTTSSAASLRPLAAAERPTLLLTGILSTLGKRVLPHVQLYTRTPHRRVPRPSLYSR